MGERRHRREPAGRPVRAGDALEVSVERVVPGGAGLAHAEGLTVFVPLAAPGDRLRVRVERVKGRVAFAALVEILEPGPDRIEPPCPYFGRCGGCDFQQLNYAAQLRAKVEIIRDCLRRIGRLTPPEEIPVTPSPAEWRYRSRARWQHDAARRRLGYYELASHRVCDVAECPVVLPEVQDALSRLRASRTGARDESDRAATPAREEPSPLTPEKYEAGVAEEFQAVAGDDGVSLLPPLTEEDARERRRVIAGETYRFNAECFFQINHALLDALIAEALGGAERSGAGDDGAEGAGTAVDLYCGVGLFTLPLARKFGRVIGVESHPTAARYARLNLEGAGLANARVEAAEVGDWLLRRAARVAPADFVLLDPPRAGAAEAIEGILTLRPRRITYVSCDPATLARDLRSLADGGFVLDSLHAFDMFPQTHHVETVAHLSRAAAR
ncbi:MAG TPA: class I SAM-dependent RNA methyltransferase [Pyrinomonadaceae bacterium]|nr:class I SAM-dependent RNA methyltransferase [Pyrinomonadaceae bacterium]